MAVTKGIFNNKIYYPDNTINFSFAGGAFCTPNNSQYKETDTPHVVNHKSCAKVLDYIDYGDALQRGEMSRLREGL